MSSPEEVLSFWLDELAQDQWYREDKALDQVIRDRFGETLTGVIEGRHSMWLTYPSGALAYIILTDQLSRNIHRGTAKAFATDSIALAAAKSAINHGWDMRIDEPARQFFYLPLMHSESQCDQDRCVRLTCERMPIQGPQTLLHARAHRQVIREFGRFPTRNAALGRASTRPEAEYLERGGYGETLRMLQMDKAA